MEGKGRYEAIATVAGVGQDVGVDIHLKQGVSSAVASSYYRFEQERRSGVGMFGGDYEKLMHRNLRAIGEDLALALAAFD